MTWRPTEEKIPLSRIRQSRMSCVSAARRAGILFSSELYQNNSTCPKCGHLFRMNARRRIELVADEGSFAEHDSGLQSVNRLEFPDYEQKLKKAKMLSREKPKRSSAGECTIQGYRCCLFAMEAGRFYDGQYGLGGRGKITRLFEFALAHNLPVIGYTVSGGARMQEGILSLMQMAKTSGAVLRHSQAGNLYISVLTDPTTGGVSASFALEGDIILAEPGALIGFAGPRVIEQTIRKRLPEGFQRAEFFAGKRVL